MLNSQRVSVARSLAKYRENKRSYGNRQDRRKRLAELKSTGHFNSAELKFLKEALR